MTFRIGKTEVIVSFPFMAALALILVLDTKGIAVAGILAAFLHEIGHFLWMLTLRMSIKRIGFMLSGIKVDTGQERVLSYGQEAALSLAGPALNLLAAGVCALCAGTPFLRTLMLANLVLMGLNLLPIQALDGGSAFEALLCMRLPAERAEKISFAVSVVCLIPLTILGFLVVFQSAYNFTLLILALFLAYNIVLYSRERGIWA